MTVQGRSYKGMPADRFIREMLGAEVASLTLRDFRETTASVERWWGWVGVAMADVARREPVYLSAPPDQGEMSGGRSVLGIANSIPSSDQISMVRAPTPVRPTHISRPIHRLFGTSYCLLSFKYLYRSDYQRANRRRGQT